MSEPKTYPNMIPYLTSSDAGKAMEFYKTAFDAVEIFRLTAPDSGKIGHCEFTIGDNMLMVADEFPGFNQSPTTLGGVPVKFTLMVPNADEACAKAEAAGATIVMPPSDRFYGFRSGCVRDPSGHEWMLQHQIEKVTPEEMQKRWNNMTSTCE